MIAGSRIQSRRHGFSRTGGVSNSQASIRGWRTLRQRRTITKQATGDSGFTLIEVLVALAILGMSLSVLLGIFSVALDRTQESERKSAALGLAQELLVNCETAPAGQVKEARGETGDHFLWRLHLEPYGRAEERGSWQGRPVTVLVTVSWEDHGRRRSVALTTLRILSGDKND